MHTETHSSRDREAGGTTLRPKEADLVLAGGGVKGLGLAGAVAALTEAGAKPQRISGTSAGAVVGALVASGLTGRALKNTALGMPYADFLDPAPLERVPVLGPAQAVLRGSGIYKGDYAHEWIRNELAERHVHTFGDLKLDDKDYLWLPRERRYKLVVTVSDVTLGQLVRLPWDYESLYGLNPDEQSVADAVRASMSIPFFFRPVRLTNDKTKVTSTLVDGGLLSNFPIDSLDRTDGEEPRWPTFGITVLPNLPAGNDKVIPLGPLAPLGRLARLGAPHLLELIVSTILVGRDQAYLNQPWVNDRAIRVDSTDVGVVEFDIGRPKAEALYAKGYEAAKAFLKEWDWEAYLKRYRA